MKVCEVTEARYPLMVQTGIRPVRLKCAVFAAVAILALDGYAQQFLTVSAKKIAEKEASIKVVSAVQKDFPSQVVLEYYLFPADKIQSEWSVVPKDTLNAVGTGIYYTVLLRGKRGGYIYGLYSEDGELQMVKILYLDFAYLPPEVRTAATSDDYDGYQLRNDKYIRIIDRNHKTEYVQVVVEKGHIYKVLVFTNEGKLIKENNNPKEHQ